MSDVTLEWSFGFSMIAENTNIRKLDATQPLSALLTEKGITTFGEVISYVHQLPYGRNSSRANHSLVLSEGRGTCSSKHAFIKQVAIENQWDDVELILAIVEMNGKNTPKISRMLQNRNLEGFPEAHCYLKIGSEIRDLTFPDNHEFKFENSVLVERIIQPESVINFKIEFHISYMKQWCNIHDHNFDKTWLFREKCIEKLSQ